MQSEEKLQRTLGYRFADVELLTCALTHRSHSSSNYERLEFLGDSILNFVIAEALFERFDAAREGQLSRLRARMVRRQTLAELARDFGIGDHLIMGSGELKSGGFDRDSILSDSLEAIIGAIFIDAGLDTTKGLVLDWFEDRLDNLSLDRSHKDAKTRLQEYLQAKQADLPEYEVIDVSGKSHDQTFVVECRSELFETVTGEGNSRRIAEQNAAMLALEQLGVAHDPKHA